MKSKKGTPKAAKVRPKLKQERCALYDNCAVVRPWKGWKFVAVDMCGRYAHLRMEADE